jgi:hypothetical protein
MDDSNNIEIVSVPSDPPPALPNTPKTFRTPLERDKYIIERYLAGLILKDISKEVGLSEVRISQIVKNNKRSIFIDREVEKARRFREIKKIEYRAKNLQITPKDTKELLAVYEAQRKELEGDSENNSRPNQTLNISLTNISGEKKSQAELWEMARKLLGQHNG